MNIRLRNTSFFSFLLLMFFYQGSLFSQDYDPPVFVDVIEGQTYPYQYGHVGNPSLTYIFDSTSHYGIVHKPASIGNQQYIMNYSAGSNLSGQDTVLLYLRKPPFGRATYRTIYFNVIPSKINAEDDFTTSAISQTTVIDVVSNDYSNRAVLNVTDVPMVNNGTASIVNNKVSFTPASGFEGLANFNYVVCDDIGTCEKATVHVCVGDPYSYQNDTVDLITIKNSPLPIFTPISGYSLSTGPSHGTLNSQNGILFYEPDYNYSGSDDIVYQNSSTGFSKTILVDVMNVDKANDFVKDDVSYTFIDETVEINILENDVLGPALYNVQITGNPTDGTLTYIAKGYYIYQPNSGFEGVDEFTYSASSNSNGSAPETGTVNIIVSDQEPVSPVFELQTPENTALVINYNIPVKDFDFVITDSAAVGLVEYYPGHLDTLIGSQNIIGENLLIYYPNNNSIGKDSFQVEYCAGSNQTCPSSKVIVDVQNYSNSSGCIGTDCVWPGDGNLDGIVDSRDLLPTGWCIGDVGEERSNSSVSPWYGQDCNDWGTQFGYSGVDLKHLDSNGDSIINVADTLAISQHYQKSHSLSPEPINFPSDIPLFLGSPDTIFVSGPGDTVRMPIILGDPSLPALDIYGLTFAIDFDPSVINASESLINFDKESWVSYTSPTLNMVKKPFEGRIDAAYTRTNGISSNGYGRIGTVDFIIVDDLDPYRNSGFIYARISGSYLNGQGSHIGLPESIVKIDISGDDDRNAQASENLMLFPNPAFDFVNYRLTEGGQILGNVEVFDLTGRLLLNEKHKALNGQIFTGDFLSGVYVIKVKTSTGTVIKKFEVISGY